MPKFPCVQDRDTVGGRVFALRGCPHRGRARPASSPGASSALSPCEACIPRAPWPWPASPTAVPVSSEEGPSLSPCRVTLDADGSSGRTFLARGTSCRR